jgi:predicted transcriptional regulator
MTNPAERDTMDVDLMAQVTEIVSAYVSRNAISAADLPALIADTHRALRSLSSNEVAAVVEELTPAVSIRKSVTPDYIVCLDDGKKFKSLKRHLSVLGMTPDEYRAKWRLPKDYPMVAPNYAATRSALAKSNGLGRKPVVSAKPVRKPKARA